MRLEGELAVPGMPARQVYFDFSHPAGRGLAPTARPFLLAFLLPAMRAGLPLVLKDPVDRVTVENLMEWQAAYAAWRPGRLRVVRIEAPDAEAVPPSVGREPAAITAFSGGVDSCFTAMERTRPAGVGSAASIPLRAGLMVHGFDIPLDQADVFESAWRNSRAILQEFGLEAYRLRTNVREVGAAYDCDWGVEGHGLWLGAALSCLEPWFDALVIPASYSYPILKLPWGSNPVTDPLMSSARVRCWHDGAAFAKPDKARALASSGVVTDRVRVCWRGRNLDRNCGHCFKCIATQAAFWLAGVERPGAFPSPCSLDDVRTMAVKGEQNAYLLATLESLARDQGRWELAQALAVARSRARSPVPRRLNALRRAIKRWVKR